MKIWDVTITVSDEGDVEEDERSYLEERDIIREIKNILDRHLGSVSVDDITIKLIEEVEE